MTYIPTTNRLQWRRCPLCHGVCHWYDSHTEWVCENCDAGFNRTYGARFAPPHDVSDLPSPNNGNDAGGIYTGRLRKDFGQRVISRYQKNRMTTDEPGPDNGNDADGLYAGRPRSDSVLSWYLQKHRTSPDPLEIASSGSTADDEPADEQSQPEAPSTEAPDEPAPADYVASTGISSDAARTIRIVIEIHGL